MSSITCNWIKHHLIECKQTIISSKVSKIEILKFIETIKRMGNNPFDLYVGVLTISEIEEQILSKPYPIIIENKENFKRWLGKPGYKKITLADNSQWILRFGNNAEMFIHIHPARTGMHTMRLKGSAWKTALALTIMDIEPRLESINKTRKDILSLSPVKNLTARSEITKALNILNIL